MLRRTRYRTFYRTVDGHADYEFELVRLARGGWRVYVLTAPNYGARDSGAVVTHRLRDVGGRTYICWSGELRSLNDALRIAARWADATQAYVAYGVRF